MEHFKSADEFKKKYPEFRKDFFDARAGFSDNKLENLSSYSKKTQGLIPWLSWHSETTGFGKTFRFWAFYPKFLPLFICSDHGVDLGSVCWNNEINSPFDTFFCWNRRKVLKMRERHNKKAYHVPHPWSFYRKKRWGDPPKNRNGTLIFYPHSSSTSEPILDNFDEYINSLKKFDKKFHPFTICLSFHDILFSNHLKLRKYGFPIVTAGSAASREFTDCFYSLIYQFKYATSPNVGSHEYYCLEANIPFFLFGDDPEYKMYNSLEVPDGIADLNNYFDDEVDRKDYYFFQESLYTIRDKVSRKQKSLVAKRMGLDANISRLEANKILTKAAFLNFHRLFIYVYEKLFGILRKNLTVVNKIKIKLK